MIIEKTDNFMFPDSQPSGLWQQTRAQTKDYHITKVITCSEPGATPYNMSLAMTSGAEESNSTPLIPHMGRRSHIQPLFPRIRDNDNPR